MTNLTFVISVCETADGVSGSTIGCVTHERAARLGPVALMCVHNVENNMSELR